MTATTIQKWGNSQGIRIPKYLLDSLQWTQGEKIIMRAQNNCLVVEQAPKTQSKTIQRLFENFNGDHMPCEMDWGKPEGREVW